MFDVVQDNVIEKVVNNRNENVYTYLYKISLIFNNNINNQLYLRIYKVFVMIY